jgi:hypothetical protein
LGNEANERNEIQQQQINLLAFLFPSLPRELTKKSTFMDLHALDSNAKYYLKIFVTFSLATLEMLKIYKSSEKLQGQIKPIEREKERNAVIKDINDRLNSFLFFDWGAINMQKCQKCLSDGKSNPAISTLIHNKTVGRDYKQVHWTSSHL